MQCFCTIDFSFHNLNNHISSITKETSFTHHTRYAFPVFGREIRRGIHHNLSHTAWQGERLHFAKRQGFCSSRFFSLRSVRLERCYCIILTWNIWISCCLKGKKKKNPLCLHRLIRTIALEYSKKRTIVDQEPIGKMTKRDLTEDDINKCVYVARFPRDFKACTLFKWG